MCLLKSSNFLLYIRVLQMPLVSQINLTFGPVSQNGDMRAYQKYYENLTMFRCATRVFRCSRTDSRRPPGDQFWHISASGRPNTTNLGTFYTVLGTTKTNPLTQVSSASDLPLSQFSLGIKHPLLLGNRLWKATWRPIWTYLSFWKA